MTNDRSTPACVTRARRISIVTCLAAVASLAPIGAPLAAQTRPSAVPPSATPAGAFTSIDWRLLAGLDYETGKASDTLKKLDGQHVRVPGFIVPLDDADQEGAEFLLVPYYGACVHTPPPPPNQMAFVQMAGRKAVKLGLFDAVWLEGTLRITNYDSPYGQVGYQIEATSMKPYTGR
ncbi:MAG: DUF3299 domain-containing protein [Gemmatimonadaceae bacterium]|nr:DUF3299 domain-containing protein [Gemmatimonadaceae bacterium]